MCRYFNITTTDIFSKKRTKNIVEPRMIAIYLITELLSMPLMSIGQLFGGRDHTTVIHARDKITEEIWGVNFFLSFLWFRSFLFRFEFFFS